METNALLEQRIGQLEKKVDKVETTLEKGFESIHFKLDFFNEHYIRREELDRALKSRDDKMEKLRSEEIKDLQDNQKWVVRIIIGMVLVALIGLVLTHQGNVKI